MENGRARVLAEKFLVEKIQITDIVFNKEEIYKKCIKNRNGEHKLTKLWICEGSVINNELLVWFRKVREKNVLFQDQ